MPNCVRFINYVLLYFIFFRVKICAEVGAFVSVNKKSVYGKKLYTVFENKPYIAFWKIPYAEAPIGQLRFKSPKIHLWPGRAKYNYSIPYNESCATTCTEDCLYLTIYMPLVNQSYSFSVIVWIHEMSYQHGPDFFIDEDVIMVAISFRTGVFGFLNTGDDFAEGNMGAKDMIAALRWIKEYIVFFGGDKNKVTVIGSGKAASSVASFLITPAADDLFARLVVQSGSALSPADYNKFKFQISSRLLWNLKGPFKKFNKTILYDELTNASTNKLLLAAQNLFDSTEVRDNQRLINTFGPTVESTANMVFMKKHPLEVYNQRLTNNNVEMLIGYTSLESIYKLDGFVHNRKLLECLTYNFQYLLPFEGKKDEFRSKRYNQIRKKIMDFYFVNGTIKERSLRRYAKYLSDQVIYPILRQARLQALMSCNNVYLYRFAHKGSLNNVWETLLSNLNMAGATAGDEICYQFKCKSVNKFYNCKEITDDRRFVKKIVRLLTNFANYGNPTPTLNDEVLGDLKWEPLARHQRLRVMNLGKNLKMTFLPEEKRLNFWDNLRNEFFLGQKSKHEL